MGSDNNCNNYYNIEQNSGSSTPYYHTLSSQNSSNQSVMLKNINNEWVSTESNPDANGSSQNQDSESEREQIIRSEMVNSRNHKNFIHAASQQHLHMSSPYFPIGSSYQKFYGDSHYGIVITPTVSQQGSLVSTPSSSLHSLNSDIQSQNHNHHVHQMQTSQHLKKIYYQGAETFKTLKFDVQWRRDQHRILVSRLVSH